MKFFKHFSMLIAAGTTILFNSCKKNEALVTDTTITSSNTDVTALLDANIPESFKFETSKEVKLDITILAPDNSPIKNIPVKILSAAVENNGVVLFKAFTDADGKISGNIQLPAYYDQVIVDPAYLGVMRNAMVNIVNNTLTGTIGGTGGFSGNIVSEKLLGGRPGNTPVITGQRPEGTTTTYMGTYNNAGKPNYLEPSDDKISSAFLANINASLPETRPVPIYHPDFLSASAETNLNITALSDVWFTFVTEGAGYSNSIGFYTYATGNPPANASAIDSVKIILPNASLNGSGGQLSSGNKVKLGRFNAGTSIGFVLIANGWNGSRVGSGYHRVYSNDAFNSGSTAANKRQTVLLFDNTQNQFLVGFEDQLRDSPGCDHDFNDCIFYVKSNPVTAISQRNVNKIDKPVDADGDGVNDVYDDFPNDPKRAYINYYPSENSMGTHIFEDNWPFLGDYDMNDLVVDYRYTVISNGLNKPVEMNAKYVLKASGATFKNGFGVQLPFASSLVQLAKGSLVKNTSVVKLGANGCEDGQSKAVIIPFDDAFTAMNATGNFINTVIGVPNLQRDTISMDISFTRPLTTAEFGTAPFNPFIIISRTRGREAHLPGYEPTDKADTRYFKTGADNTIPAQKKYYVTKTNLPWAVDFGETFEYPAESKPINAVYTKFVTWAQSNGVTNKDWYKDALNTVKSKVYKH